MKKKIIITISTLLIILIITLGIYIAYDNGYILQKEENHKTYIPITYEICDDNSCIYLLGSIHIGDSRVTKFDNKLINLYNKSKYLAVELDTKNITMDLDPFIANPNETLNDILENKGILTYDQLQFFKIGYVANYLSLLPSMELNLTTRGVDEYFLSLAHKENKEIIELETYEEQLSLLFDYSNEFYINQIKDTIENYEEGKEGLKELYEEYLKANKENLEKILEEETITTEEDDKWKKSENGK